jgi:hypothetical protein
MVMYRCIRIALRENRELANYALLILLNLKVHQVQRASLEAKRQYDWRKPFDDTAGASGYTLAGVTIGAGSTLG